MRKAGLILTGALLGASCGAPPPAEPPPAEPPVLVVDGRGIPVAAFDAYVAANFDPSGLEEPLAAADEAAVRSRLFDDFVSEETMLAEASARGIRVGDGEARAWLPGADPEDDPATAAMRVERARRELAVRKLLDALVLERPGTDEATLRREVATRHRVEPNPAALPFAYRPEEP